jgi:hypothetical protein
LTVKRGEEITGLFRMTPNPKNKVNLKLEFDSEKVKIFYLFNT